MNKMEIWLIEDDDDRIRYIKYFLKDFGIKGNLRIYKNLNRVSRKEGSPDIIAVDTTQISGRFPSYTTQEQVITDYRKFRHFVEKHPSSRFIIYCAVEKWAKDFYGDLVKDIKDAIIEFIEGSPYKIAQRIYQLMPTGKEEK